MTDKKSKRATGKRRLSALSLEPSGEVSRKQPRFWTTQDDEFLRTAVMKHGEQYWTKVAKEVPNRNAKECVQRWKKVLAPGLKKGKWSDAEDQSLIALIEKHGQNWTLLSECMKSRSSKQCRERWMNHLNPDLKKTKWSAEEDAKLLELAALYPRKWAEMARGIPGRTENMAKCRYHTLVRRKAKLDRLKNKEKRKGKKRASAIAVAKGNISATDTETKATKGVRATPTSSTTTTSATTSATPTTSPSQSPSPLQLQLQPPLQMPAHGQAQVNPLHTDLPNKPMTIADQIRDLENLIGKHLLNSAPNPGIKAFSLPPYPSNMTALSSLQYPALLKAAASIGYNQTTPPLWYLDYQKTLSQQPNFAANQDM